MYASLPPPARHPNAASFCMRACGRPASTARACRRACVQTYVLEAAADAGFDVGASEGGHLPQLPRDLDGFVKQQAELPLVTRVTCRCHLAEEV